MKRVLLIIVFAAAIVAANSARAGIGWTRTEAIRHWGAPIDGPRRDLQIPSFVAYKFEKAGIKIIAVFDPSGKIERVTYYRANFSLGDVEILLHSNVPSPWQDGRVDQTGKHEWQVTDSSGATVAYAILYRSHETDNLQVYVPEYGEALFRAEGGDGGM